MAEQEKDKSNIKTKSVKTTIKTFGKERGTVNKGKEMILFYFLPPILLIKKFKAIEAPICATKQLL